MLLRSVRHLLGDAAFMESNAPAGVNIGLTRSLSKPGQYILSIVNTTSGLVHPIRELIPVHDIWIRLRLDGKSMVRYTLLRCQGDCKGMVKGRNWIYT